MKGHTDSTRLTLGERLSGRMSTDRVGDIVVTPRFDVVVNMVEGKEPEVTVTPEPEKKPLVDKEAILAPYRIRKEPFYVSQNNEVELFAQADAFNLPVMLKGPTGCGKTRFLEHMAFKLGDPIITVSCQEDLKASDLTGRHLIDANGTYWLDGPLTLGVRHGAMVYLDEVVEARNDVKVLIHSLTDHRRQLYLDRTQETITADNNFNLVVSFNPHYQSALKEMKPSTRQRFIAIEFDYLPKEKEIEVVGHESGVDYKTARQLVELGHQTRELRGSQLKEGASTRLMIYAGQLIRGGVDPRKAAIHAMVQPLTDDPDVRVALEGIVDGTMKG